MQQQQSTHQLGALSAAGLASGKRPTEAPKGKNMDRGREGYSNSSNMANRGRSNNRRGNGSQSRGRSNGGGPREIRGATARGKPLAREPSSFVDEDYISSDEEYSSFSNIDDMIVSTSHLNVSSKKSTNNLNHLLNFSYVSYADQQRRERAVRPVSRRGSKRPMFQKERFVQANYRFVVRESGDFRKNLIDPDVPVDWEDIVQVHLSTEEPYNCPICLEEPVVGKITKCGHIFCWTCLIRYMEGKSWKRCPICFESVNVSQLKSVAIESISGTVEGQTISFSLLQRSKDSTIPTPRNRWTAHRSSHFPHYTSKDAIFSRLSVISDATPIFEKEHKALQDAISVAQAMQDESLPYLAEAQSLLSKKYEEWLQHAHSTIKASPKKEDEMEKEPSAPTYPIAFEKSKDVEPEPESDLWSNEEGVSEIARLQKEVENMGRGGSFSSTSATITSVTTTPASTMGTSANPPSSNPTPSVATTSTSVPAPPVQGNDGMVVFYQETSGNLVFLNPVNTRMILEEYGSYERFPSEISGVVLELEEVAVSDELRKRHKFFRHLPLSCGVLFCEIDMSSTVSKRTMNSFGGQLRKRAEKRRQRQLENSAEDTSSVRRQAIGYSPAEFPSIYEELQQIAISSGPAITVEPPKFSDLPPIGASTPAVSIPSAPDSYAAMVNPGAASTSSSSSTQISTSTSPTNSSTPSFSEALRNATSKTQEAVLMAVPGIQRVEKRGKGKGKGGQQLFVLSNSSSRRYGRN